MTPTERLILYGIKHLIDREIFTPELRKEMDKDICNKIVDLVAPLKEEEPCCEMPEELPVTNCPLNKDFSFVSNSEENKDE